MKSGDSVVVAMSGGVDSSVAAALLVQQGFKVTGMMLRLWSEPGSENLNRCCTPDAMNLARRVAGQLKIPFYPVDVRKPFRETVVTYFLDGYSQGRTPNPCLVCNQQIRWGILLDHALAIGAGYMATGHYAQTQASPDGSTLLLRATDSNKDQSYILSGLNQAQLSKATFPVGGLTKPEVRVLAENFGLPVAHKSESQDLCFITSGDYRDFITRNTPKAQPAGPIKNSHGDQIGEHHGLANYTIGQRKGLGISSPVPLYVIEKDPKRNILVVGEKIELGKRKLQASDANWISKNPPKEPFKAKVQIRYRAKEMPALVTPIESNGFEITFEERVPDITPGQLAVIYDGVTCLGSGIIEAGYI